MPGISLLHAKPDAHLTLTALRHFPLLWSWGKSDADLVRQADLRANQERGRLVARGDTDPHAYFRELAPEVVIRVSAPEAAQRLHELSQKTNQFNLALRRLTEVDVAAYLSEYEKFAIGVSLKDRLSDSGMIAAMFGRIEGQAIFVDEWVISCRALGRGMENYLATQALRAAAHGRAVRRIVFSYAHGARNAPGLAWLASYANRVIPPEGPGAVEVPYEGLRGAEAPISLEILHYGKKHN